MKAKTVEYIRQRLLAIEWPLEEIGGVERVILADKDKNLNSFKKFMELYGGL